MARGYAYRFFHGITTVTCGCGYWVDVESGHARNLLKHDWTYTRREGWKCPRCNGKETESP